MIDIQIIIPRAPSAYEITYRSHYEIWKQEREAKEEQFVPVNIRFEHDPEWRGRLMSITCIQDSLEHGPHNTAGVFWAYIVRPLFVLGSIALPLGMMALRFSGH